MSVIVEVIKLGKKGKHVLKKVLQDRTPVYMSSVRRIEQVKTKERVCAMTFDDGPFDLPPSPANTDKPLTLVLLETLEKYGAKGSFDIIGDTSGNYPDVAGKEGTAAWGGVKFDHYPDINQDKSGGAVHCPQLVQRILDGGHELTNHGFEHIIFGRKNIVYGKRETFHNIEEVVADLEKLHNYVKENFNYEMKLSRPPHYVDDIPGGHTSYDAYHVLGYQYMAASYDGAGWLPCATYEEEVRVMYAKMEETLKENPDALCGQIIFQKDGYNMARRTPVADGLGKQLAILQKYGYKVISVSDLMDYSEFTDVGAGEACFEEAMALTRKGYCVAYKDNTLRLENPLTRGELAFILYGKQGTTERINLLKEGKGKKVCSDVTVKSPYAGAIKLGVDAGVFALAGGKFNPEQKITAKDFNQVCGKFFANYKPIKESNEAMNHKAAIKALAKRAGVEGAHE